LGGNGLLIWQFHLARLQAHRLTAVNQQLVAILRLQESIRQFHVTLDDLSQARDARRLGVEAEPLRRALLEYTKRTRVALSNLPSGTHVDEAFLPTLEAIEIALPSQLDAIRALAESGDWDAVRLRLANEMKPMEFQSSALVKSIDQDVSQQLAQAVAYMEGVQQRIFIIVPLTAIFTFLVAAFFGWTTTRRITELRAEERIAERTRIARELHDTLLQGFISASIQLHVAVEQLPENSPAKPSLGRVLQLMGRVIEEGREAVRGFRSIKGEPRDLEEAFSRVQQELALQKQVDFRLIVEGRSHSVHPAIRDEIYSIGREALVNAFRHSRASRVEVELEYSGAQLRVIIRDDGVGIDSQVLAVGREGHWGLSGMHERAKRIGANLKVWSRSAL
jgi:signal transduction histidine kinase